MMARLGCADRRYARCSSDRWYDLKRHRSLRATLSARLIVSLILGVSLVSLFSTSYEVRREKKGLRSELERRAEVLGESLVGNVEPSLEKGSLKELKRVVERFSNREHLAGVAVFNAKLEPIAASSGTTSRSSASVYRCSAGHHTELETKSVCPPSEQVDTHLCGAPPPTGPVVGELVIVHDASYINAQSALLGAKLFCGFSYRYFNRIDYSADCPLEYCGPHCSSRAVDEELYALAESVAFVPPCPTWIC